MELVVTDQLSSLANGLLAVLLLLAVTFFTVDPCAAAEESESKVIQSGCLFVSGDYIPPPYEIKMENGAPTINGHPIEFVKRPNSGFSESDGEPRFHGKRRALRRINRGFESSPASAKFAREFNSMGSSDWVEDLRACLFLDGIVVLFDHCSPVLASTASDQAAFCAAMLADQASEQELTAVMRIAPEQSGREQLRSLLSDFRPNQELASWMNHKIDHVDAVARGNQRTIAATRRLDQAEYPLTLIGMVLGVVALGHNLKWSARDQKADEIVPFVKIALLLIVAMSVLDLIWTLLTSQAGQMREINPIASSFLNSPLQLIVFKTGVTATACGILFSLRQSSQAQAAVWWLSLICILLTFRWVVFSPLML